MEKFTCGICGSMDQYVLKDILEQKGFIHLNVQMSVNMENILLYSLEDVEKVNRTRLTKVTSQYYQ